MYYPPWKQPIKTWLSVAVTIPSKMGFACAAGELAHWCTVPISIRKKIMLPILHPTKHWFPTCKWHHWGGTLRINFIMFLSDHWVDLAELLLFRIIQCNHWLFIKINYMRPPQKCCPNSMVLGCNIGHKLLLNFSQRQFLLFWIVLIMLV